VLTGALVATFTPALTGAVAGNQPAVDSYSNEVLADAPSAYWRLGEASGTTAVDEIGTTPGTYTGGVTLGQAGALQGSSNTSALFDGVNDYVTTNPTSALDATTAVTIEAWAKRTRANTYQVIVGKPGNGQSKFENYALWFDTSNLAVAYFGNGSTYVRVHSGTPLDANWHYIVATYDNTTARIYVDAVLVGSATAAGVMGPNQFGLNIGRARTNGYYFQGQVDEVAVYPSALSQQRIQDHWDASQTDLSPPIVTLTTPPVGATTGDSTPTFGGVAGGAPGDLSAVTVKVYSGSSPTGTPVQVLNTTRQGNGSYSVDAPSPLADGVYTAQTEQSDAAGNTGFSTANTFSVDLTAPAVTLAQPADGSSTGDTTPTFSGTGGTAVGDASSVTVKVYAGSDTGGTLVQTLSASLSGGAYSIDATNPLAEGTYTARTQQADGAGNTGFSTANTFSIVDQTAPIVTLTAPANGSVTGDSTPTFAGVAGSAPGDLAAVTVKVYSGSSPTGTPVQVLNATRQGNGSYSVDASDALAEGIYTAQAEQSDAAGNAGLSSANTFSLDLTAPTVTLAQPADGSSTGDTTPTFSGTGSTASGDAGTVTVKVYAGSDTSGTLVQTLTTSLGGGAYSVDATNALAEGTYTARTQQSDNVGNTGFSSANTFSVVDQSPPVVTLTAPANNSLTSDPTPTFSGIGGTAPGDASSVTVKVYSGTDTSGTLVQTLTASVGGGGGYSVDAPVALAEGIYTARTQQSDASGNTGFSSANTFRVDVTAPAVTLTQPPNGSTTTDTTPTFSGTGGTASGDAAFVTVKIYAGTDTTGTLVQTLTASLSGAAYAIDSTPLPDGLYTVRTQQSDTAGNTGFSSANTFRVDSTAPTVTLAQPANGSTTSDTTPTFSGTGGTASGDASSVTVKVYNGTDTNGTLALTQTANLSGGTYAVDAPSALAEGVYTARTQQSDTAGNTGFSSANTFTISIAGGAYRSEILADNPTSYWRLGDLTGTTMTDERSTNAGTYVNGVSLNQAGPIVNDTNRAVSLDGVNDYATVPDANSLDLTSAVSLEVWMKRTKSAAYQVVAAKPGNGQSKFENYALWLNTGNQLVAYFGNGTTYVSVSGGTIDTNWHHVVATYDNATAKIYVDGTLRASAASSVTMGANALPLNIGRSTDNSYFYGGLLDELAVYPTALSATRIRAHYDAGLGTDATAPVITLTTPANGSSTNDTTPTLGGVAGIAPGDSGTVTVKLYSGSSANGTPIQTLTTARQSNGNYAVDAATLAAGTYTAQAEQLDVSGNRGLSSPSTFSVDVTMPVVTLTQPAQGAIVGTLPTFQGVAGSASGDSASVMVEVYLGSAPVGTPVTVLTAQRQGNNSYSVVSDTVLFAGTYTARAKQSDAAGNMGLSSANTFIVSTADLDPPNVTLQTPANGSSTLDTTPTFSGQGGTAAGDLPTVTVRIYVGGVNGTLVETLLTTISGSSWSVDASPSLAEGIYTAQAEQSDAAGNVGHSSANTFQIGTSYRDEVIADGARAYWRLGESSGATAADSAGTNTGTYGGGVTLGQPGVLSADPNTAISVNGTSGYMTAPDSTSLDLAGTGATMELWIKRTQTAQYQVVLGKPGDGQSKNENYALWLIDSLPVAYFGNGSSYAAVYASTPLDTNWHYVVATYDNANARIYIDGVLNATASSNVHLTANSLPLNLGRGTGGNFFFGGSLDEVALYPTALSGATIQDHYAKANALDTTPPDVTLTTPADGSATIDTTPALAGGSAITATDSPTVTIKVYSGSTPTGTPVQTLTAPHFASGSWSTSASPALPLGTYTAQATQVDTAGNVGLSAPQTFTIRPRPPVGGDQEFIGAGDIAYCEDVGDEATALLLDQFPSATVFTLGDNAYESGTAQEFNNCYQPTWGRAKARTRPILGDHDYADGQNPNATGYMGYFQNQLAPFGASATDPNRGYYSYDLGTWHVVALNSNCGDEAPGCSVSTQLTWLQNDLAAHPNTCTLALVSSPRYSSGEVHGDNSDLQPYWAILANAGAELWLAGDDHLYERFAPMDAAGAYQSQGMRQITVGTGGRSLYPFKAAIDANSETRQNDTYGIMRLVLRPGAYEWEYVPQAGRTFIDSGTSSCH